MSILKILKEYIRRIVRNYKIYVISILGMGIAVIASFHIYLFAFKEINTNSFHTKQKDIYRLVNKTDDSNFRSTETFIPLGPLLKEKLPQVADYVRIAKLGLELKNNEQKPKFEIFYSIDATFFEIFDFSLKEGSLEKFMDTPNGIVLSERKATVLFGEDHPIGKSITVISHYNGDKETQLIVTGVLNSIPENSTVQGDMFLNMSGYYNLRGKGAKEMEWMARDTDLYVYAPNTGDINELSNAITDILMPVLRSNASVYAISPNDFEVKDYGYDLQRLDNIYFDSMDIPDQERKGDFQFVSVLILVGLLTLFMATTNYIIMNLGLNMNRAREFKMRRCLGASKGNIFIQLLIESLFNAMLCFGITLISYPIIGDFAASLIGFDYNLSFTADLSLLFSFMGMVCLIGLIIGVLEYLLSYRIIFVNHKYKGNNTGNSWKTKKLLIGFQLALFIGLTTCILFVGKQINYIQDKDLGYDTSKVMSISTGGFDEELKNKLEAKSYVKGISRGQSLYRPTFRLVDTEIVGANKKVGAMTIIGDANYLKINGMELVLGKNLNPSIIPERENFYSAERRKNRGFVEVLVNQQFVKKANLKSPIGTVLKNQITGIDAHIVGVFKNVNNTPLYYPVQPTILGFDFNGIPNLFQVSCDDSYRSELISEMKTFFADKGAPSFFIDNAIKAYDYKDVYKKELQLKNLLQAFTVLVFFISLLGMVAISLFIAESRTKEIAIRKVNGATISEILSILNKDYIKWVGIAFIFTIPLVWYIMNKWLENFAYKTTLSWWVFVLAGGIVLLSALLTVSWQSYRTAMANPVESLRSE